MSGSNRPTMAAAVSLALSALDASTAAEPGDLIAFLPSSAPGPTDIALDEEDGTYWVTSFKEREVFHFTNDLKTEIGRIALPFANPLSPLFSGASGIAYDSLDGTLLVVDSVGKKIWELGKDGDATGRVFDVPLPQLPDFPLARPGGMTFDPAGDEERGSIYIALVNGALIEELTLEGDIIRSFPPRAEIERRFGSGSVISFNDVHIIGDGAKIVGFYVTAYSTAGRNAILKLDKDGALTDISVSLAQAAAPCDGLWRGRFPRPDTGEEVDAFVLTQSAGSRFVVLGGGEPSFREIVDIQCAQEGRNVAIDWTSSQTYDMVEVLDGCAVLATLPGDARRWEGVLEEDGVHELRVRGIAGFRLTEPDPCKVIAGAGRVLVSSETVSRDSPDWIGLTADGRNTLIATNGHSLSFFDLNLKLLRTVPISEFALASGDWISGLAYAGDGEGLYLYNGTQDTIVRIGLDGELLSSVESKIPRDGEDPNDPDYHWAIGGVTFNPAGNTGRGSLWVLETKESLLYELDLGGNVLGTRRHPFSLIEPPTSGGFLTRGIAEVAGSGFMEIYVRGSWASYPFRDELLRVSLADGQLIKGSEFRIIPPPGFLEGIQDFEELLDGGKRRLFVLARRGVFEIETKPPTVPPPTALFCRQRTIADEVELRFLNQGPYDTLEVFRDCEKIAEVDGAAQSYIDRTAAPGFHEFAVRGVQGVVESSFARDSLQVGTGAVLQRASASPVISPYQTAWNPVDGTLFVLGNDPAEWQNLFLFDAQLKFVASRTSQFHPTAGGHILTLTVRVQANGAPVLYLLFSNGESFTLLSETSDGDLLDNMETVPPRGRFGSSEPVGLTWDPVSDTFYYLEGQSDTFVQMDLEGKVLRTFPHPLPPPGIFIANVGCSLCPERRSIFTATATPDDIDVAGPGCGSPCVRVARIVEVRLDGTLTGYEIPTRSDDLAITGFALVGQQAFALSGIHGEIVRLKALNGLPGGEGNSFLRGDSNGDAKINLSDAVATLLYLFSSGAAPPCLDAADADDSGKVEITDAIFMLGALFLGANTIPEPYPGCGQDPTAGDALGCGEGCR